MSGLGWTNRRVWVTGVLAALVAAGVGAPVAAAQPGASRPAPATAPTPAPDAVVATGDVIVKFASGSPAAVSNAARDTALGQVSAATRTDLQESHRLSSGATVVQGAPDGGAAQVAAALQARPDVAYAEPEVRLRVASTNDPLSSRLWALRPSSAVAGGAGIESVWPYATGRGVTVAVVDSGILAHPDLAGRVVPGYDFVSDPAASGDGTGRDADPSDPGDWTSDNECKRGERGEPSSWHGTHVAGTVAAVANNGIGLAGAAPGAKVLPVRVLGTCGGTTSDIADGIVWSVGGSVRGAPVNAHPARVVNLSLGGPAPCSATIQAAITVARAKGAVVVTAAGNDGRPAHLSMPGNCAGVVDVAAASATGVRAPFSDYGSPVALAAPGVNIYSTFDAGSYGPTRRTYAAVSGTSMAAPHVSAVAAMMVAARPTMTPDAVRSALVAGARRTADTKIGAGLLDAPRALAAAGVRAGTSPVGRTRSTSAAPRLTAAPMAPRVAASATAVASWAPFAGSVGSVRYDVQIRSVTLTGAGRRSYTPWRAAVAGGTARSVPVRATPGAVVQYRVRGTDSRRVVSAWSPVGVLVFPVDATASTGAVTPGWRSDRLTGAVGSTMLSTARAGASFTARPVFTNSVYVVAGAGRGSGTAAVYVDGVKRATVSLRAGAVSGGHRVAAIAVPYGRHTVRVVNVAGTVRLDGVGFGR